MKVACAVCSRSFDEDDCKCILLTAEEKRVAVAMGYEGPNELHYCKPCWKILTDREQGAQLIRGIAETGLRRMGLSQAEQMASKLHAGLMEKTKK